MEKSDDLADKLAALGLNQDPEEFLEALPAPVKARVAALKDLQKTHDDHEEQYRKERAELEAKYAKLYAPLYEQRAAIVSGAKDVPSADVTPAEPAGPKGVPNFWLGALARNDMVQETINEKDLEVLKYLINIEAAPLPDEQEGFKLIFTFADNPYFTNKTLEKTYVMLDEDFEPVLESATGTTINWNAGKDPTVKILKKKPKKGARPDAKPQTKTEAVPSFFNFFTPPEVPENDAEMEEEEMEELQGLIENDYELGLLIKEKIIPNAVHWYTGEAADEDEPYFFGEEGDEDDDEDEEGEEDDDEDDDDEEGDEPAAAAPAAGKSKGNKGAAAAGEQPPECKQQ